MKDRPDIQRILRIMEMERIFDTLTSDLGSGILRPQENPEQRKMLRTLIQYYESPLWREDYEADERGEIPKDLKRGILSQDGLYDFLTEIQPLCGERKDIYDR